MRKLWVFGASAAATAAGVVLALPLVTSGTSLSADELHQQILKCTDGSQSVEAAAACLHPWWENAVLAGNLGNLDEAVTSVLDADPALAWACHDVGHLVGAALAQRRNSYADLVGEVSRSTTCDGGLIHGVLDQFGTTKPSMEDVQGVIGSCSQIGTEVERDLCADGVGHAAWQATSDARQSVQWCQFFRIERERHFCYGGILMQLPRVYFDGRDPAVSLEDSPEALPQVCIESADLFVNERDRLGCFSKAAQQLGLVPASAGVAWARAAADGRGAQVLWEEMSRKWNETLKLCVHFPVQYRADCREEVIVAAKGSVPVSFQLQEQACRVWEAPEQQRLCAAGRVGR